jgi:hypothetical protein
MGAKAEIGWTRRTDEGVKLDIYAQHIGDRWIFHQRERRNEQWQRIEDPPLEDWLELLDSVQRRIQRRLLRPEEEANVKKAIHDRFPEANA